MKHLNGNILIKMDVNQKGKLQWVDGGVFEIQKGYDFNLRLEKSSLAIVISGNDLPTGANVLVHHLSGEPMYLIDDPELLTKEETKESSPTLPVTDNADAYRVLKNFYVSEKASLLNGFNQYVFSVFRSANKSQIGKQVEKLFNVKVKSVKVLNMPRKRRDLGRHPGFKSEFKKAIVVLEQGQTIEQAKP